jgi:hypothetical protein
MPEDMLNGCYDETLLTAANEGAILAGPEGATPLLLDGGDGTLSGQHADKTLEAKDW